MTIVTAIQLEHQIALLKHQEANKKALLIEQFHETYESLKPMNLIKGAFNKTLAAPNLSSPLLSASLGVGAGVLSKRILTGKSPGFFKRMLGTAVEVAVARLVAKNSDAIKNTGLKFIHNLSQKHKSNTE